MPNVRYLFDVRDSTLQGGDNRITGLTPKFIVFKLISDATVTAGTFYTAAAPYVSAGVVLPVISEVSNGLYSYFWDARTNGEVIYEIDCGATLFAGSDRYLSGMLSADSGILASAVNADGTVNIANSAALVAMVWSYANRILTGFGFTSNANVTQWLGIAPNALAGGRVDVSVGAYPGNTAQTGDSYALQAGIQAQIGRLLGLSGENQGIRNITYTLTGALTSCVVCLYDIPVHAALNDGVTGLVHSYTVSNTYKADNSTLAVATSQLTS